MEVKVRITQVGSQRQGTSRSGKEYTTQEFIGETFEEQYPHKICFLVFNNKVSIPAVGSDVVVSFDIESRSYAGRDGVERWSTDVKPYRIESATEFNTQQPAPQPDYDQQAAAYFGQQPAPQSQQPYLAAPQPSDDYPF